MTDPQAIIELMAKVYRQLDEADFDQFTPKQRRELIFVGKTIFQSLPEEDTYTLADEKAKPVFGGTFLEVMWFLRHACEDGIYSMAGPDTDCTFDKKDGTVWPSSGTLQGERMTPDEAEGFFNRFRELYEEEDE